MAVSLIATYCFIFFLGFFVWTFSTVAGGGGPLLFLPAISFVAPLREVAPITSVTAGLVSIHRVYLFWQYIDWRTLARLMPGSALGATLGVHIFSALNNLWLIGLLAAFLIYQSLKSLLAPRTRSFTVRPWHLPLAGALFGATSAVVGASGQGINIFLLNKNISGKRLIATKAVDAVLVQSIKIIGYIHIAAIGSHVLKLGLLAAGGAMLGNYLGKHLLHRMSDERYRLIANSLILVSGLLILFQFFGSILK